jgi:heme exporter protein B
MDRGIFIDRRLVVRPVPRFLPAAGKTTNYSLTLLLALIRKELTLELRRKSVIAGISLYLFSLTFICYIAFSLRVNALSEATWSALYWLIILFAVVNSVAKSFISEPKGLETYYYSLLSPYTLILSKIIYNTGLCILLALAGFGLLTLFINQPVKDVVTFLATIVLTSGAFSAALSLISGIAAKTRNSNILMAVLSFPVLIAVLLLAVKVTKNVIDGLDASASWDELLNLLAINVILGTLAYILFPYIWRS